MKPKPPTIQQLVDLVKEYNTARELELRTAPLAGFPKDYQNPLMEALYDAATAAAAQLAAAVTLEVKIR